MHQIRPLKRVSLNSCFSTQWFTRDGLFWISPLKRTIGGDKKTRSSGGWTLDYRGIGLRSPGCHKVMQEFGLRETFPTLGAACLAIEKAYELGFNEAYENYLALFALKHPGHEQSKEWRDSNSR